tara:strand:+ start:465 stop:938 length:474 start_codon:yes stop_codon:yes gene_type:complete
MRPVSEATAKITNQVCGRKYIALGRILSQWTEIVGPELATKVQPSAIKYRKYKQRPKNPDAVLEIATSSAYATKLHYQKDLILERINQVFGEQWISGIRFINVAPNTADRPRIKKTPVLTPDEKKYISETLDYITDIEVRNRLENFGQSLLLDNKKT